MVTIWTTSGTYTGRTVATTIRRVFGRDAYLWGELIVHDTRYGTCVDSRLKAAESGVWA